MLQKFFDEFSVTLNRNSGVIYLKKKCHYIHAVHSIMPEFSSLPVGFDEICITEFGGHACNSRLLAKACKIAKISFTEIIDHFCQDAEKSLN